MTTPDQWRAARHATLPLVVAVVAGLVVLSVTRALDVSTAVAFVLAVLTYGWLVLRRLRRRDGGRVS